MVIAMVGSLSEYIHDLHRQRALGAGASERRLAMKYTIIIDINT